MDAKVEARVTHHCQAAAERVFDAWLDPAQVRVWLRHSLVSLGLSGEIRRVEIDARVGGKFFFSDMRDGVEAKHWGTYLELERPRRLVFTWIIDPADEADPSRVTLAIEPAPKGSMATISHEMDAKWVDYISRTESGWARMLAEIDRLLTGD